MNLFYNKSYCCFENIVVGNLLCKLEYDYKLNDC